MATSSTANMLKFLLVAAETAECMACRLVVEATVIVQLAVALQGNKHVLPVSSCSYTVPMFGKARISTT